MCDCIGEGVGREVMAGESPERGMWEVPDMVMSFEWEGEGKDGRVSVADVRRRTEDGSGSGERGGGVGSGGGDSLASLGLL